MRKNINQETIEGRVYEHDLTLKNVTNQQSENFGKEFISGSLSVATDEEGLNVLTVHYTYVTAMTKQNKPNVTFSNLKRVMESKTWVSDGKDAALKVRLAPSAALNDFYPQGGDELVSQPRNEGGFVTILSELSSEQAGRNKFTFDTIINNVELVEATEENHLDEDYAKINCVIFNYRNDILPFTLVAKDSEAPGSVEYFMGLNASPSAPVYTQVKGKIVSTTVKVERTVEGAFGAPSVDISERRQREWIVTWAKSDPYLFDDESTMTAKELSEAIANRNVYLETVKTRAKEYYNNRGNAVAAPATPAPNSQIPAGGFNF